MNYTRIAFEKARKQLKQKLMSFNFEGIANTLTGGIFGLALGDYNDQRQLEQQRRLQELQVQGSKDLSKFNMQQQYDMWLKTNYGAQVEQLKKAGLNPALLYGKGGPGGITGSPAGAISGAQAPSGGREIQDLIGMGIQSRLLQAQEENIKADTKKKEVEAAKTAGVDTENVKADTENKVLQQIITKYTGQEAKDIYEKIKSPNRSIEAKTYQDELAARQGVAGTIYELWIDGKLHEKSIAEIEQILLQNAKSREETKNIIKTLDILEENLKGAKLDNVIKDLETKLQTETGIDRNSPTWMKILGRLFVLLGSK